MAEPGCVTPFWTVVEVQAWLRDRNLTDEQCKEFNGFDGRDLLSLQKSDWVEAGLGKLKALAIYNQLHPSPLRAAGAVTPSAVTDRSPTASDGPARDGGRGAVHEPGSDATGYRGRDKRRRTMSQGISERNTPQNQHLNSALPSVGMANTESHHNERYDSRAVQADTESRRLLPPPPMPRMTMRTPTQDGAKTRGGRSSSQSTWEWGGLPGSWDGEVKLRRPYNDLNISRLPVVQVHDFRENSKRSVDHGKATKDTVKRVAVAEPAPEGEVEAELIQEVGPGSVDDTSHSFFDGELD